MMIALLTGIANFVATLGSSACIMFWMDEPTCPKDLIK